MSQKEKPSFKLFEDSGFAFFDDPTKTLNGGWFSRAGENAHRFQNVSELLPPTLWITNIDYNEFRNAGLVGAGHLRRPDWLKTTPRALCMEIGYPQNVVGNDRACQLLSEIYNRVNQIAWSLFPDMKPQATLARSLLSLARDKPVDDSVLRERRLIESATQDRSVVPQDAWEPELITVRFVPNRIEYFTHLLTTPVPVGKLEKIKKMKVEEFVMADEPLIAEVTLDHDASSLCAFGYQGSGAPLPRKAITQTEAIMLLDQTDITVDGVWRTGAMSPPPLFAHLPRVDSTPFLSVSYSMGLLYEAMAFSLMEKSNDKRLDKADQYYYRQRACYLKSVDRTMSFALAKDLNEAGISRIYSYGMGQVSARVIKDDLSYARELGAECGFMMMAHESEE